MNVCYVTMVFPATSETFACLDVRMLREAGVSVSVYAMRSARPRGEDEPHGFFTTRTRTRAAAQMLADRGLGDLQLSHGTWASILRGVRFAATHPSTALDLIAWIWRRNWHRPRHLLKSLALVPRSLDIFSSIQRARPDVVHLFWGHYPAIVGYLVRRQLPNIILSMFLGAYDLNRHYPGSVPVAHSADVVWTHCRHNVDAITKLGVPSARLRMVHRGIDLEPLRSGGAPKVPQRVVTAGRLGPEKAMGDVLSAFALVRARWPGATLVVLGHGSERSRLESQARALGIARAVSFRGHVRPDQVREEMARAEVFTLLSRSVNERLPNVVKEAMASNCACVVSRTPGIEELVEDGVSGFVASQGDVETAARHVDRLFRHPEQRLSMAAAARDHVLAQFDVRHSMSMYQECWRELLARRLGPALVKRDSVGEALVTSGEHSPARAATPGT